MMQVPSGPNAAPFGPPPVRATTLFAPSAAIRVSVPPAISTTSTEPSPTATGPSGNCSSSARVRISIATTSRSVGERRHLRPVPAVEFAVERRRIDAVAGLAQRIADRIDCTIGAPRPARHRHLHELDIGLARETRDDAEQGRIPLAERDEAQRTELDHLVALGAAERQTGRRPEKLAQPL